jgi:hypothetical protein
MSTDNTSDGPKINWPAEKLVRRRCEMDPTASIQVNLEDDGDVEVTVYSGTVPGNYHRATVQFCSGFGGGGRSPRTRAALISLMKAIEEDNKESPQTPLSAVTLTKK